MEDIWKIPDDIAKKSKEKNDWIDCYFKLETILKGENITGTETKKQATIKFANEFIENEGELLCSEEVKKKIRSMNLKTLSKGVKEIIVVMHNEMGTSP